VGPWHPVNADVHVLQFGSDVLGYAMFLGSVDFCIAGIVVCAVLGYIYGYITYYLVY
jgi:hypothetical protein